MKVLYCSNYLDGTGWSEAGINGILSLDAAGIQVVPRPLKLNNAMHSPPARVLELESRSSAGCTHVIQHTLPHLMSFNGNLCNIAMFESETSHFRNTCWADRLNLMDFIWVRNNQQVQACHASGVTKPVKVVPHATNVTKFQQSWGVLDSLRPYKDKGDFLFYFIGEHVRRKNLLAAVKAFHLEFDLYEPVQLVIKASVPGASAGQAEQTIREDIHKLKQAMKQTAYKTEVVLTERLTEAGLYKLHSTCDAFVSTSFGEGWCLPAMDAMGFGKTPIVTNCTGFLDYIDDTVGYPVSCREEPCIGATDSLRDIYVANESWWSIDVNHLRRCMRAVYENKEERKRKARAGVERVFDFSYEAVGSQMRTLLANDGNSLARPA